MVGGAILTHSLHAYHETVGPRPQRPLDLRASTSQFLAMTTRALGLLPLVLLALMIGCSSDEGDGGGGSGGGAGSGGAGGSGGSGTSGAGGGGTDICQLPAEVGPCNAAFQRYFFNAQTGRCEEFVYGGCDGNANNFETLEACEQACGGGAATCALIDCQQGFDCVYVDSQATCAEPCMAGMACPAGSSCVCGSSCPGCEDCRDVCVPD